MWVVSAYPAVLPPTPRLPGPVPGHQKPRVGAELREATKNPIKSFKTQQRVFLAGWALNGLHFLLYGKGNNADNDGNTISQSYFRGKGRWLI